MIAFHSFTESSEDSPEFVVDSSGEYGIMLLGDFDGNVVSMNIWDGSEFIPFINSGGTEIIFDGPDIYRFWLPGGTRYVFSTDSVGTPQINLYAGKSFN